MLSRMKSSHPRFDRASHLRDDLNYLEAQLRDGNSRVLPVFRDETLVEEQGDELGLFMPRLAEASALIDDGGELVWLGELEGQACFAVDISDVPNAADHPAIPGSVQPRDLRFLMGRVGAFEGQLGGYARGMLYWHRRHRHCGHCGTPTRPRKGGHVRVCDDDGCGHEQFPRTDPAILVVVQREQHVLLGRQPRWPKGMYSALAGFVEPGESLEEAVVREVREETGIEIGAPVYRASQPWPFPASLMVGFTAEATSHDITLGDEELEDAQWFHVDELNNPSLPGFFVPPPTSLAGDLLRRFAGLRQEP